MFWIPSSSVTMVVCQNSDICNYNLSYEHNDFSELHDANWSGPLHLISKIGKAEAQPGFQSCYPTMGQPCFMHQQRTTTMRHWLTSRVRERPSNTISHPPSHENYPSYGYQPLNYQNDSIRVLELLPGPPNATIQCRMHHTTIQEIEYSCLSYTWQPTAPEHAIIVDGRTATVGDNLWQFLRAFQRYQAGQKTRTHERIWIDAICIKQLDTDEKNH
jgi:hypothetical protein